MSMGMLSAALLTEKNPPITMLKPTWLQIDTEDEKMENWEKHGTTSIVPLNLWNQIEVI